MRGMRTKLILSLAVAVATTSLIGCKNDQERINLVVTRAIDDCKTGTETFYELTLFDKSKRSVLRQVCDEPMGEIEMLSEWSAKVQTGPVTWIAGHDKATSAWVVTDVQWEDLDRARRLRLDTDATPDVYELAETSLAAAQKAYPDNGWIRMERLRNLLDLRNKTRAAGEEEPWSIGPAARAHLEELVAWAGENNQADLAAEARLLAYDQLRVYRNRQLSALDAIGSQDAWTEKAIEMAIKEGRADEARERRAELEESQANAEKEREIVNARIEATSRAICDELGKLSASGVSDADLRARVTSTIESTRCTAAAQAE